MRIYGNTRFNALLEKKDTEPTGSVLRLASLIETFNLSKKGYYMKPPTFWKDSKKRDRALHHVSMSSRT